MKPPIPPTPNDYLKPKDVRQYFALSAFLLLITFLFTACKSRSTHYFNHSLWNIPNVWNADLLKGKPKMVRESLFINLSDSSIDAQGFRNDCNTWIFDNVGNLIERKYAVGPNDSVMIITKMVFNNDGFHTSTYSLNNSKNQSDTIRTTSKLLENGKFLQTSTTINNLTQYKLCSFTTDGNISTIETVKDTADLDKISSSQTEYFQNNFLTKIESKQPDGKKYRRNYFRSENNLLDSILYFENDKLSNKEIFTNNKQGDIIRDVKMLANGKIIGVIEMQYQYDEKGNWIKLLYKTNEQNEYGIPAQSVYSQFSITTREITY